MDTQFLDNNGVVFIACYYQPGLPLHLVYIRTCIIVAANLATLRCCFLMIAEQLRTIGMVICMVFTPFLLTSSSPGSKTVSAVTRPLAAIVAQPRSSLKRCTLISSVWTLESSVHYHGRALEQWTPSRAALRSTYIQASYAKCLKRP
jgi:hypothetical protein